MVLHQGPASCPQTSLQSLVKAEGDYHKQGHGAILSLLLHQIPKYHDNTRARASEDTREEIQCQGTGTQGVALVGQGAVWTREPEEWQEAGAARVKGEDADG